MGYDAVYIGSYLTTLSAAQDYMTSMVDASCRVIVDVLSWNLSGGKSTSKRVSIFFFYLPAMF